MKYILYIMVLFSTTTYADDNRTEIYSFYDRYEYNLFTKGCNENNSTSCYRLADIYRAGEIFPPDKEKALSLYIKACQGGITNSCSLAGMILYSGSGVSKDTKEGIKYFNIACDLGSKISCRLLRE